LVIIETEGIIITLPEIMEDIGNKEEIIGTSGGIGKKTGIEDMTISRPLILQVIIKRQLCQNKRLQNIHQLGIEVPNDGSQDN